MLQNPAQAVSSSNTGKPSAIFYAYERLDPPGEICERLAWVPVAVLLAQSGTFSMSKHSMARSSFGAGGTVGQRPRIQALGS